LDEYGLGGQDPSMVYRILRDMEELNWVSSTWDEEQTHGPPRRIYEMSTTGSKVLTQWVEDLEQSKFRIERFLRAYYKHMKETEGAHHWEAAGMAECECEIPAARGVDKNQKART
jgi:DNA-binding PadR family transcriptional regulator